MNTDRSTSFDSLLIRLAAGRVAILFIFHAVVFAGVYAFAWLLRFEFAIPPEFVPQFKDTIPFVVGTQLVVGAIFGFYRGWWRYVGIADVIRLVFGLTSAMVLLMAVWYTGAAFGINEHYSKPPRGVFLIDWSFCLLALFGARVAIRLGRDRWRPEPAPGEVRRVIIVGAGDAGETLAREIEHRPQLGMKLAAFVDDQRAKWGSHIRGVKVYGPITNLAKIADDVAADEALIAIPSASGKRVREIIHHLSEADLQFKTIPGIDQLVSGRVNVTQLRPVNIEDLLRRRRIELPGDPVRQLFRGKRVVVTGAGGTIGSELASQVLSFEPKELHVVERSEFALYECGRRLSDEYSWSTAKVRHHLADIRDTEAMSALLREARPEIVLHAAAHKHVPLGEENPPEYLRNNCVATVKLAQLCEKFGIERFVFISTDKAINPTSVMGATKRAAEIALLDLAGGGAMKVTIVRFGNVIGSSGSVIPLFLEQIQKGQPVTVTHPNVTRYFIRTSEAISLVLQAATLGENGRVFMLDMGEPVKIADLARDLIRLSNHSEEEIPIVFTGLRPGEKLFEEIRLKGEDIFPTVHPQIVVTESRQPKHDRIAKWLEHVSGNNLSHTEAIEALRELLPEYTPAMAYDDGGPKPSPARDTTVPAVVAGEAFSV